MVVVLIHWEYGIISSYSTILGLGMYVCIYDALRKLDPRK